MVTLILRLIHHPPQPDLPWLPAPPDLQLSQTHLDIFQSPAELPPDEHTYLASLLSPEEHQKAARFLLPAKRTESEISRGLLRHLLGQLLNTDPRKLTFTLSPNGKPLLLEKFNDHSIAFNVSHTQNRLLIAFSVNAAVGIDIERIPPNFDWQPLARQFFTPTEFTDLLNLPASDQPRNFFREWVRKEALLKATGLGITDGLSFPDNSKGDWSLTDLPIGPNYTAAVAQEGHPKTLRLWRISQPRRGEII